VSVFSSPSGASVLIDGIYIGTTPGTVYDVPAGNHILRLTLSGYHDYEGSVYVVAGQTVQAYGTLQPVFQAVSGEPTTPAIVQVIVPVVTAQPAQDSGSGTDTGIVVAVIGAISVIIVSVAKVFTHIRPPRKE
jgi:hypothetical protein